MGPNEIPEDLDQRDGNGEVAKVPSFEPFRFLPKSLTDRFDALKRSGDGRNFLDRVLED